jgi:uncharacterized membrane protein YdbT with pleckstrin-like domain
MVYPRRLLNDHETVTVDLHPHWWFLVLPVVAVIASMAAAIATMVGTDVDTTRRTIAGWASLVALGVSAIWLVIRYSRWLTTHFVITNRRIIFRTGLVTKRGIEIPVDRVNTVHFSQGVFERIVGAGDLLVESGGESGQQRLESMLMRGTLTPEEFDRQKQRLLGP